MTPPPRTIRRTCTCGGWFTVSAPPGDQLVDHAAALFDAAHDTCRAGDAPLIHRLIRQGDTPAPLFELEVTV